MPSAPCRATWPASYGFSLGRAERCLAGLAPCWWLMSEWWPPKERVGCVDKHDCGRDARLASPQPLTQEYTTLYTHTCRGPDVAFGKLPTPVQNPSPEGCSMGPESPPSKVNPSPAASRDSLTGTQARVPGSRAGVEPRVGGWTHGCSALLYVCDEAYFGRLATQQQRLIAQQPGTKPACWCQQLTNDVNGRVASKPAQGSMLL